MEIFPADTLTTLVANITELIADNVVVVLAVLGFAIGVAFVTRWFSKSTKKIKAH